MKFLSCRVCSPQCSYGFIYDGDQLKVTCFQCRNSFCAHCKKPVSVSCFLTTLCSASSICLVSLFLQSCSLIHLLRHKNMTSQAHLLFTTLLRTLTLKLRPNWIVQKYETGGIITSPPQSGESGITVYGGRLVWIKKEKRMLGPC